MTTDSDKYLKIGFQDLEQLYILMLSKRITRADVMLFIRIAQHSWGKGDGRKVCFKTTDILADEMELSIETVRASVRKLKKFGFIDTIYRVKVKHKKTRKIKESNNFKVIQKYIKRGGTAMSSHFIIKRDGVTVLTEKKKHTKKKLKKG